jgi:hypothetical protein
MLSSRLNGDLNGRHQSRHGCRVMGGYWLSYVIFLAHEPFLLLVGINYLFLNG